jgi:Tat protein secretion system quality control protein TatD with DNase activity
VVEAVAEVKQITATDAAEQIAKNFENFFNIKLA